MIRGVFKRSAAKIEAGLKDLGFKFQVNTDKPRKGAFVVTMEGVDEPIVELLNLARPFKKLRELDIDEVIETIKNK